MATRRFNPPDLQHAQQRAVGPYTLAKVYRTVPGDEGETIHVFGPIDGEQREILRFDCFRNEPHIHLGISYLSEPVQPIDAADPFDWALKQLAAHFPDYLERSQAPSELPDDWQAQTAQAVDAFRNAHAAGGP